LIRRLSLRPKRPLKDRRALFTGILDFCARVLAIQFGKHDRSTNGGSLSTRIAGGAFGNPAGTLRQQ
jgi:hypothetical protein